MAGQYLQESVSTVHCSGKSISEERSCSWSAHGSFLSRSDSRLQVVGGGKCVPMYLLELTEFLAMGAHLSNSLIFR